MTEELMLLLADHATGYAYWTPPAQWYLAYFEAGVEIVGGSYARQPITAAQAVAISSTHVRSGSANGQLFENLPTTDVDELRIVDTPSGAITLTGWVIPHVRSFTAGDDKGYAPDKIGLNLQSA